MGVSCDSLFTTLQKALIQCICIHRVLGGTLSTLCFLADIVAFIVSATFLPYWLHTCVFTLMK
jgi:hypothetical protein